MVKQQMGVFKSCLVGLFNASLYIIHVKPSAPVENDVVDDDDDNDKNDDTDNDDDGDGDEDNDADKV